MSTSVETDFAYLQSLGVISDDIQALLADSKHTTFVVAQSVFSGVAADKPSISVPIVLGSSTIKFTLRKNLSDNDWWLDEERGDSVEHTLFGLHKFAHYDAEYTYIVVSPYAWSKDNLEDQLLCLNSASLLIRYN